jgi:hypothetical protein
MPPQHRHGYTADLHRGLPIGDITRPRSSPHGIAVQVGAAHQPESARLELEGLLRGFQPLVPHVRLSVSLAGPRPSGSAGPSRRCQGCFRPHPRPGIRLPSATAGSLRRAGGGALPSPLGSGAPRDARRRRPTTGSARSRRTCGPPGRVRRHVRVLLRRRERASAPVADDRPLTHEPARCLRPTRMPASASSAWIRRAP